jgi:hypothetical protein
MKKEELQNFINQGLSQRKISEKSGQSHTSIRYWLKKYSLKTKNKTPQNTTDYQNNQKYCSKCDKKKPLGDFYERFDSNAYSSYCKKCSNKYYTERVRNVKIKMIEYKGGCCERCILKLEDTHYSVFDFHHINPQEKDPNFGKIKYQKWSVIKEEIDKCMLVCSNCHRIIHAELEGLKVGSLDVTA